MSADDTGPTVRAMGPSVHVEIWSDVVCPWCYIGKRRFEQAVEDLAGEIDVTYSFRAYQLDPTAPPGASTPVVEAYARKFGGPEQAAAIIDRVTGIAAQDGLEFRLDRATRANTLSAHRVLWLAEQPDSPVEQRDVKERLLQAYFTDGLDIGDHDVLVELAGEVGLDADRVRSMLDGDEGTADVAAQLETATDLGITAVPTFVVGGKWSVPGAQDAEVFVQVLRRVAALQAES